MTFFERVRASGSSPRLFIYIHDSATKLYKDKRSGIEQSWGFERGTAKGHHDAPILSGFLELRSAPLK
jgi:hypothetical protein